MIFDDGELRLIHLMLSEPSARFNRQFIEYPIWARARSLDKQIRAMTVGVILLHLFRLSSIGSRQSLDVRD